jgi:glycosyltransferase involved in cell wall biosynthesis
MVRITYLIRKTSGGMQSHIIDLLSKLDRTRFEPLVISPKTPKLFDFLTKNNIPFEEVDIMDTISIKSDLNSARRVRKIFKKAKPDIVHIHGNKAAIINWLAQNTSPSMHLSARRRPKCILTVHNYPSNISESNENRSVSKSISQYMGRAIFNKADLVIAVSEDIKRFIEASNIVDNGGIRCIHNGIDIEEVEAAGKLSGSNVIDLRKTYNLDQDSFLICGMGRLVPFKALDILIKSVYEIRKSFPNVYAFILGDGPLRTDLENLINERGLNGSVFLLGHVDDPLRYLAGMDLFAFPSVREPFGIALLEAAAIGVPIVAARAGGVPEIIQDRLNGLLAEPGDVASFTQCILNAITDSELRTTISKNGRERVAKEFSLDVMAEKTMAAYERCLN